MKTLISEQMQAVSGSFFGLGFFHLIPDFKPVVQPVFQPVFPVNAGAAQVPSTAMNASQYGSANAIAQGNGNTVNNGYYHQ